MLSGEGSTAQNQAVIANAAVALRTEKLAQGKNVSLLDCVAEAQTALESKKAEKCFQNLLAINSR